MTSRQRPFLIDVTRLISRSWTGRQSTGIDRVCYAYLEHFRSRALGVVQHRGVFRILDEVDSNRLFAMLLARDGSFRMKIAAFGVRVVARSTRKIDAKGAFYINVSHTDFDLPSHAEWIAACNLRPIYLLHDLIPILHPEYCTGHAARRHRGRVIGALVSAAGIVVNSATTAHDLADFASGEALPLPPLVSAHLARSDLSKASTRTPGCEVSSKPAVQRTAPYFLCVGTIERRKNHLLLFKVWARLAKSMGAQAPHLVIVGQPNRDTSSIMQFLQINPGLQNLVTVKTSCTDAELKGLIEGATALLLPSLAEGFGIPLIEGLELGTPVIASDLPCFREIGQGIPTLLDPADIDLWDRTIRSFLDGGPERQRQMNMMSGYQPSRWSDHFALVEAWLVGLSANDKPALYCAHMSEARRIEPSRGIPPRAVLAEAPRSAAR